MIFLQKVFKTSWDFSTSDAQQGNATLEDFEMPLSDRSRCSGVNGWASQNPHSLPCCILPLPQCRLTIISRLLSSHTGIKKDEIRY